MRFYNLSPASVSPRLLLRLLTLRKAFVLPRLGLFDELGVFELWMELGERSELDDDFDDRDVRLDAGEFLAIALASLSLPGPPPLTGLPAPTFQLLSFFESTIQLSAATALATRPNELPAELIDDAGDRCPLFAGIILEPFELESTTSVVVLVGGCGLSVIGADACDCVCERWC